MGAAALPGRTGQRGADRGHQPGVGIGGDELDPGQAAGGQVAEEREPAGAVLAGGDLHPQDLAVSIGVDTCRDEHVYGYDAAAFAHLEDQGVGGHERERTGVLQSAGAELLDVLVEFLGHHRDLGLGQASDAQRLHEFVHPAGGDPEQVAGRHHAGQGPLGTLAPLQQPVRVQAALPQLGHRHIQGADPGVQVAVAVAVAGVDPLAGAFAVACAAHRVGLRGQQRVDERGQQVPHQVRARLIQLLGEELGRVDTGSSGHRRVLLRVGCERSLEGSTRWPRLRRRHAHTQVRRTPLCWTPLACRFSSLHGGGSAHARSC